jgi:hypothetical protein
MKDHEIIEYCRGDAARWAECFHRTFPNCPVDQGTMLGWFANAMMAAVDALPRTPQQEEVERLQEALTPSLGTKAAYMGEFQFGFPDWDEDGNEVTRNINIPWTAIKEIMAAIRARAALKEDKQ